MKLNIGETIKRLRKEREVTQEEFAELLGVSCQSVSRWENNACYPDIELLPTIAGFFGISTDNLMGIDEAAQRASVENYRKEFQEAVSKGNIEKCIRIARKGVAEFPNNYVLLNQLMYALFLSESEDADIPDWKENMEAYDAEIVALGERIIKYCPDTELRLEATARLAMQHCDMGRNALGHATYETLPSMRWCKEASIWWALAEDEKLAQTRDFIDKTYAILMEGMYRLSDLVSAEDAIKVLEKGYALEALMYDNAPRLGTWGTANDHFRHAKYLMALSRQSEVIEQLNLAANAAIAFDNRPEEEKTTSLLLGEQIYRKTDWDTADSRSLCEILRDSWLSDEVFDEIRDAKEFKEIVDRLK